MKGQNSARRATRAHDGAVLRAFIDARRCVVHTQSRRTMGNSSSSSSSSSEEEEIAVPAQSAATPSQATQPPQTGSITPSDENPYAKNPRFTAWASLLAASLVVLTSVIGNIGGYFSAASWVLLVSVISIVVSIMSLIFYTCCHRKHFVGKMWGEGVSSYVLLFLWVGGTSVCMSPSRKLAVSSSSLGLNFVSNANLYFSRYVSLGEVVSSIHQICTLMLFFPTPLTSWASFLCILYISGSWTMTYWTKAAEIINDITGRLTKWWGLFVASVVVLVSSGQFHVSQDCPNGGSTELSVNACRSNRYAISLGAWSCFLTLVCILLAHIGKIRFCVETVFAVILFIFYTAGIALITYNEGSGITVGNLFFSTWIGFILTLLLCIECYLEHMKNRAARKAAKGPSKRELRREKKKEESKKKKKKSKKHHVSTQAQHSLAQQPAAQPTNLHTTQALSWRSSSIGEDEFSDARDDLELQM